MEPSYLELRGAIDLLRAALKTIPTSGWQGATYYNAKPAETQAYCVISRCITDCYRELNAWNSKIVKQASALSTIGRPETV